jgi:hypothetical protein
MQKIKLSMYISNLLLLTYDIKAFSDMLVFYSEELLAHYPIPKLKDEPLSTLSDCLFNIFTATLHTWRPSPPPAA